MLHKTANAVIITGITQTGEQFSEAIAKAMLLCGSGFLAVRQGMDILEGSSTFAVPFVEPFIFIYADLDMNPVPLYEPIGRCVVMSGKDPNFDWDVEINDHLDPFTYMFALALDHVLANPELDVYEMVPVVVP